MGFNTSVIVMNDALHYIEKDPDFGKNLVQAITNLNCLGPHSIELHVPAGNYVNAASVVETHHADMTSVVAFGGNYGTSLGMICGYSHHKRERQIEILKEIADQF
jgi:hypothetical protein